jgi:hypothetical protein
VNSRISKRLLTAIAVSALFITSCSDDKSATTTTVQQGLNPSLPGDVNPIPYTMNMLAGMGNVQIMVTGIKGNAYNTDSAPAREVEVSIMFRNGALTPVKIDKDSFRVYTSDLNSVTPRNDPFTQIIPADTKIEVTLNFPIAEDLLAVGLVFDSDGYGERVISGQFILNPDYKGIETTD